MKRIFLLIVLIFAFNTVYAQTVNNLKITEDDGTLHTVLVGNIANITFVQHTLVIGDWYEGGILFYIDSTGRHGLVAAAFDQSSGIQWWNGVSNQTTGATGAGVGDGANNTSLIVSVQGAGSYAAQLCADLTLNGFSDWFLPSKDELNLMHQNETTINTTAALRGGSSFNSDYSYYWSSTEWVNTYDNYDYAWGQYFNTISQDGLQQYMTENNTWRVRAVRAF